MNAMEVPVAAYQASVGTAAKAHCFLVWTWCHNAIDGNAIGNVRHEVCGRSVIFDVFDLACVLGISPNTVRKAVRAIGNARYERDGRVIQNTTDFINDGQAAVVLLP